MHELATIPDGRPGLDAKVRKIRALVEEAKRDPWFRARAAAIVRHVPERDQRGEVEAVWQWVRDHVRYLRDPWSPDGLEVFTTPRRLLEDAAHGAAAEDCDGHVILASALVETIGYPTRYRIGGLPPDHFRHIWLEARTNRGWLPLELTKKDEPFEYDPSHRFPLTLTLDGTAMLSNGLGAPTHGGFSREASGKLSDAYNREMERRRQELQRPGGSVDRARARGVRTFEELTRSGAMSRSDQYGARERARMAKGAKLTARARGLSAIEPTPQEQRWMDEATTDVWTDQAMLGDLDGLRKLRRKVKRNVEKGKRSLRKTAKLLNPLAPLRVLGKAIKSVGASFAGGRGGGGGEPVENIATDPASTGLAPGAIYTNAQGMQAPAGDPFAGWSAQTEAQEVSSLYTPAMQEMIAPDKESPSGLEPEEIPDWPGTENAYADPAPSWGEEDEASMQYDDPTEVYGENDDAGLGNWLTDLAQQVASTVLPYQQARLAAKAAQKGYGPLQFAAQPLQPAATPPNLPVPPQDQPTTTRTGSGAMRAMPWIIGGVAAVTVLALAFGVRRRR